MDNSFIIDWIFIKLYIFYIFIYKMAYKSKEANQEYQKNIPAELKQEYQRKYWKGKEDKKKLKNLLYRIKHWQKTIKKEEIKKLKSCIDF